LSAIVTVVRRRPQPVSDEDVLEDAQALEEAA